MRAGILLKVRRSEVIKMGQISFFVNLIGGDGLISSSLLKSCHVIQSLFGRGLLGDSQIDYSVSLPCSESTPRFKTPPSFTHMINSSQPASSDVFKDRKQEATSSLLRCDVCTDMGNEPSSHYQAEEDESTVFISKEDDVYRIPALFYDSDRKILLAFAEKRKTSNDASAVALVMKTGTLIEDKTTQTVTTKWSELKLVKEAHLDGHRPMNPCPLYDKNSKTLFLFFICIEGTVSELFQICCNQNKARLCYITSKDGAQSWSEVTDLTDRLDEIKSWATFAVGPGHGIQTEGNRLIVPVYGYASCSPSCCCFIKFYCCTPYALYLYSDDEGKTWKFSSRIQKVSLECEMAEVTDDSGFKSIYCNARSKGGHRVEAVDKNDGTGFVTLPTTDKLVETGGGCQGSVVSFPAQSEAARADSDQSQNPNRWLLFTHPSSKTKRTDLAVYLNKTPSDPNAWSEPWIINRGPSAYSDLAYIGDGWFACLMERGQQSEIEQIACKVFSYSDAEQGTGQ